MKRLSLLTLIFALLSLVFFILLIFFRVPFATFAAPPSPFAGQWQAIDVDGGDMSLGIAGRPEGPFQITWTDNYISFCDGGPA